MLACEWRDFDVFILECTKSVALTFVQQKADVIVILTFLLTCFRGDFFKVSKLASTPWQGIVTDGRHSV